MRFLTILLAAFLSLPICANAQNEPIVIATDDIALVYSVEDNGRLYQKYFGKKLNNTTDYAQISNMSEAYITHGMEDYFEPALHIVHTDANPSTLLKYVSHDQSVLSDGAKQTVITLADPVYKDEVQLYYVAYPAENIIKTYTIITNKEKKTIKLEKYASSMLHFNCNAYYLTQFDGDWAREVDMAEQKLEFGKKVIDTKLGARANMFVSPFFQVALNEPARENQGEVLFGTLAWSGNFRFTFEVDQKGMLRVISGINPYASQYTLAKGESFRTPEFIFTLSMNGKGEASRNFHDWARQYQVKEGMGDRMTLLNNWEATYFDFNEEKLIGLIGEARELGVDMFLLDDGWFANKYPRSSDHQGLGDWLETKDKLPNGIGRLTAEAEKQGVKFGLWIEPEMVNPKSELYENHKDWVITLPNRDEYYFRNQLVLDLSNPKVQDYVFGVVDDLMTKYPDIAYFKWDCNSPITNIYSNYLKANQTHLYVDYVRGLYNVLERIKTKYPDLRMMMCSGGGGRTDYEGLKYFAEFWASDNTDPIERLFIQWGYSQIFPTKTICAHVTNWNRNASLKFRVNVAMMGKLGFDLKFADMNQNDIEYCKRSIKDYNRMKPVVLDGDLYRLVSPYSGEHTSSMYVDKTQKHAYVFAFDVFPRFDEQFRNVCLQGLDPATMYAVKEINREDGREGETRVYSGDYLMKVGLQLFTPGKLSSRVYEVIAQ